MSTAELAWEPVSQCNLYELLSTLHMEF